MRARYALRSFQAFDTHSDSTISAELSVGRLRLRYLLDTAELAGYHAVGPGAHRRGPGRPPCAARRSLCAALPARLGQPVLGNLTAELVGMLSQRAEVLAARLGQPGARGVADVADFLLLQTVNRWQPLLAHWADAGNVHPEELFATLVQMAGELATFTAPDKRASVYPAYRHDDLQRSFAPVVADLRRSLSFVLETNAVAIPLQEPKFGIRVGPITDRNLLRCQQFVLAVSADIAGEQLRRLFPNKVKIGAVEHIRELVNVALPGIAVRAVAGGPAPDSVPGQRGLLRTRPQQPALAADGELGRIRHPRVR
jgi:type VI secretion system protein ImpJ